MDFSKVKEIVIPEGIVKKIVVAGKVLWEKIIACVNVLPLATDLDRTTIYGGVGFKTSTRLSSSTSNVGSTVEANDMCTSGFIPAKPGDVIRIKRTRPKHSTASYIITFDDANTRIKTQDINQDDGQWIPVSDHPWMSIDDKGVLVAVLDSSYFGTNFNAFRFSAGVMDRYTIVTVNQDITTSSLEQYGFKNWVDFSTTNDGKTIYNKLGHKEICRIGSDGTETGASRCSCTGFIPVNGGDVIRFYGWPFNHTGDGDAINVYDKNFACIGQAATNGSYGIFESNYSTYAISITGIDSRVKEYSNVWKWTVPPSDSGVEYIRVSGYDALHSPGHVMIVTVNEPMSVLYKNWVPYSKESGGATIYNGGLGYREGVRLSSSGAEKTQSGSVATGFIPAKRGDIIRMAGATWGTSVDAGYCYIQYYDANFKVLYSINKYENDSASNGISNVGANVDKAASSVLTDSNGVTTFSLVTTNNTAYAYIRISATGSGEDMIVTVNEEIV